MHLPRFTALLALSASLAAQGQVRVVDDGAIDRGAVWMVDMNSDGTLESVRELADGLSGLDGKLRARPSRVTLGAGSAFLVLDNTF